METEKVIDYLESKIKNPQEGLPEDIFLFLTRVTPIINVDLLIKDKENKTLLTWRDDDYYDAGWHIPGGIIRYKETIADRLNAVADGELGVKISYKKEPIAINEFIHPSRKNRGHFISMLYECKLLSPLNESLKLNQENPSPGQWAWYGKCPENLISIHDKMYSKFI